MNKQRVGTGLIITAVYIAVVVLSMYVHPIFFDAFIALLAVCGAYEMSKAIEKMYSPAIFVIDIVGIVIGFGSFWFGQYFFKNYSSGVTAYFISLVVMVLVTIIVTAASKTYVKGNAISTIFVMLYPCAFLMFSMGINYFINQIGPIGIGAPTSLPFRNAGIALLFVVPAFTDMFAYLVGSTVKGKKLAPSISPNKTISGAIGGLFGGLIGAGFVILLIYLADRFSINLFGLAVFPGGMVQTIIHMLILGFVGSIFDQIGDLVASYIKRKADIKDFSNLLPGHGGVLDRVDGFIFCGVFLYMYLSVLVII